MKRRLSTAFHPQTDGQTERQNQNLEHYLRCFTNDKQDSWASLLPMAEFAYMNSIHFAVGATPFKLMYGYDPKVKWELGDDLKKGRVLAAADRIQQLNNLREHFMDLFRVANERSSMQYNRKHQPKEYQVGDLMMLVAETILY